jgi:hypothetical protein
MRDRVLRHVHNHLIDIIYNSLRRRSLLTRSAILLPGQSPWMHIWDKADDGSFLELTGFDRHSFDVLVQVLFPTPVNQIMGRPRLLDEKDKVGLYLFYVYSIMKINNLCLIFGTTPSRCFAVVRFMMVHVYDTLKTHDVSKVSFPKTYRENVMSHACDYNYTYICHLLHGLASVM